MYKFVYNYKRYFYLFCQFTNDIKCIIIHAYVSARVYYNRYTGGTIMKQTQFIITIMNSERPTYYYSGPDKNGIHHLDTRKSEAKIYTDLAEADRDARILQNSHSDKTDYFKIATI